VHQAKLIEANLWRDGDVVNPVLRDTIPFDGIEAMRDKS
jgi:hypothetical protein